VPFGFQVSSDGELVPDEDQQAAIRTARVMRQEGRTLRTIQASLETQGHAIALSALHRVLGEKAT
jgi:hypothetical protein